MDREALTPIQARACHLRWRVVVDVASTPPKELEAQPNIDQTSSIRSSNIQSFDLLLLNVCGSMSLCTQGWPMYRLTSSVYSVAQAKTLEKVPVRNLHGWSCSLDRAVLATSFIMGHCAKPQCLSVGPVDADCDLDFFLGFPSCLRYMETLFLPFALCENAEFVKYWRKSCNQLWRDQRLCMDFSGAWPG